MLSDLVNVRVVVFDGMEEIFKKEFLVFLEVFWKVKKKLRVKVKDIFGMMFLEKLVKELRMEFYEEVFG